MMSDLVERLRDKAFRGPTMEAVHLHTLEWQAADRITALEAENKALRAGLQFYAHRPHYASRSGMDSAVRKDNFGDRARALLAKDKSNG
jgi:hypothetical protein